MATHGEVWIGRKWHDVARRGFQNITRHGKLRQGALPRGWVGHGKDFENSNNTPPQHSIRSAGGWPPLRMIRRWFFWRVEQVARSIHTRRKLGEHVQVMHEGAWFLGVVRQTWPPPRGEQWRYTVELDGGEQITANAADIQRQKHNFTTDPTPQEIAERAAEIRAEWPPEVAASRWQGAKAEPVQIQRIGRTSAAGRMESDE